MDGLKKLQQYRVKELLLNNCIEAFFKTFHQKWKNASCGAQVNKEPFYTFEDIDLRESHAKLHKKRVKLWEQIEFKG